MEDKYNISSEDWEILLTLPLYISYGVADADDIFNPEEFKPLYNHIRSYSIPNRSLLHDIYLSLSDLEYQNVNLWDWLATVRNKHSIVNEEHIVDETLHGSLIREVLDKVEVPDDDKNLLLRNLRALGFATAAAYGIPDKPIDDREEDRLWRLFRYMNYDLTQFLAQKEEETTEIQEEPEKVNREPKNEGEAGFV